MCAVSESLASHQVICHEINDSSIKARLTRQPTGLTDEMCAVGESLASHQVVRHEAEVELQHTLHFGCNACLVHGTLHVLS